MEIQSQIASKAFSADLDSAGNNMWKRMRSLEYPPALGPRWRKSMDRTWLRSIAVRGFPYGRGKDFWALALQMDDAVVAKFIHVVWSIVSQKRQALDGQAWLEHRDDQHLAYGP